MPATSQLRASGLAFGALLVLTCLGAGALTAAVPEAVFGLLAAIAVLALLVLVPVSSYAAVNVAMLAIVPTIELTPSTSGVVDVVGGPARLTLVICAILVIRLLIVNGDLGLPGLVLAAVGIAVAVLVLETAIGAIAEGPDGSAIGDLSRDALYPFAAITAALSTAGDRRGDAYVWLGRIAVVVFAGSIVYWASTNLGLGGAPLERFFAPVRSVHDYHDRAVFPFASDSPNGSATSYVLLLALTVPVLLARGRRLFAVLAGVLGLAAIATTQSRTGLLALGGAVACFIVMARPPGKRLIAAVAAAAAVALLVAISPSVLPTERQLSADAPTLLARKSLWSTAVDAFAEAPLVGHGHRFSVSERFMEPAAISNRPANATTPARQSIAGTQSEYLAQLVDGGLIGGAALVTLAVLMWFAAFRMRLTALPRAGTALYVLLAGTAVAMISTQVTLAPATQSLVWLGFGMTAGAFAAART